MIDPIAITCCTVNFDAAKNLQDFQANPIAITCCSQI